MPTNLNKATLTSLTLLATATIIDPTEFDTTSQIAYTIGLGAAALGAVTGIFYSHLEAYRPNQNNNQTN